MRFEKRLDIVQQGQFAVNGKQRRNHALVHIIAGSADAHGNFIFFLLAREKFDNTFFAGKVNMIRRQHLVKLSAFGVANLRRRLSNRTAYFGKNCQRTVSRRAVFGFVHRLDAVIVQSRQQSLRRIVQIFQSFGTVGNRKDDVMAVGINAVQRIAPGIRNLFQQRIVEIADIFFHGNPFAQRNDAADNLQVRHAVNPGFAGFHHGEVFLVGYKRQIDAFNFEHACKRTIVTANGNAVGHQLVEGQKVRHAGFTRLRQNQMTESGRPETGKRCRRNKTDDGDNDFHAAQPLYKGAEKIKIRVQI